MQISGDNISERPRRLTRLFQVAATRPGSFLTKHVLPIVAALGAVLAMGILTFSASASITWRADYENGSFSQWDCGVGEKAADRAQIVTSPVRQGKYAARYEVRSGDNNVMGSGIGERVEALSCKTIGENTEQFWAWSTMFDSGFTSNTSTWNTFHQWHNTGTSGGTTGFQVRGSELWLQVWGGNPTSSTMREWKVADKTNGQWYDFVFHVKWSSDPSIGLVEVWINGQNKVQLTHLATLYQGQGVYPKEGYYRNPQSNTAVLYQDGFRLGSSYAEVAAEFPGGGGTTTTPPPTTTTTPATTLTYTSSILDGAKLTGTEAWSVTTNNTRAANVEFFHDNVSLGKRAVQSGKATVALNLASTSVSGGYHVLDSAGAIVFRSAGLHWTVAATSPVATAGTIALRIVSYTDTNVTVAWTPVTGALGYMFFQDGQQVGSSLNPATAQYTFLRGHVNKVVALMPGADGQATG